MQNDRHTEFFYPTKSLIHLLSDNKVWRWRLGAWDSFGVFCVGGRDPGTCWLLPCPSRELDWTRSSCDPDPPRWDAGSQASTTPALSLIHVGQVQRENLETSGILSTLFVTFFVFLVNFLVTNRC